jgi:hypothetical protein
MYRRSNRSLTPATIEEHVLLLRSFATSNLLQWVCVTVNITPKNKINYLKTKFKYTLWKVKIVEVHSMNRDEAIEAQFQVF